MDLKRLTFILASLASSLLLALPAGGTLLFLILLATPVIADDRQARSTLTGDIWHLVAYGDIGKPLPVVEARAPTLLFHGYPATGDGGRLEMSPGCNRPAGNTYRIAGNKLTIEVGWSTFMGCGERLMQQESAFMEALRQVERFTVVDDRLKIFYDRGTKVLVFERKRLTNR